MKKLSPSPTKPGSIYRRVPADQAILTQHPGAVRRAKTKLTTHIMQDSTLCPRQYLHAPLLCRGALCQVSHHPGKLDVSKVLSYIITTVVLKPSRKPGTKVWKRQFASDGFCSQGPWPDRVTSDSRSGCCSPRGSMGGKTRAPASRHSTGRKAWRTTSRHSELYTAPRQLIGGLSESIGSSGQRRRARGGECRDTQGFCWGRRDLWRRSTRAKKRLASYAR